MVTKISLLAGTSRVSWRAASMPLMSRRTTSGLSWSPPPGRRGRPRRPPPGRYPAPGGAAALRRPRRGRRPGGRGGRLVAPGFATSGREPFQRLGAAAVLAPVSLAGEHLPDEPEPPAAGAEHAGPELTGQQRLAPGAARGHVTHTLEGHVRLGPATLPADSGMVGRLASAILPFASRSRARMGSLNL